MIFSKWNSIFQLTVFLFFESCYFSVYFFLAADLSSFETYFDFDFDFSWISVDFTDFGLPLFLDFAD